MIDITDTALNHFRQLLAQQGDEFLGVRIATVSGGTPAGDVQLAFAEQSDLTGKELLVEYDGLNVYIDHSSAPFLDGAELDFLTNDTGGELNIKAPKLRGVVPAEDAPLIERIRYLIEAKVNPQLASHAGFVTVESLTADNDLLLRFGGRCNGCGMANVTMKQGVETTIREAFPEIREVLDATDHSTGENPYFKP